MEMSILGSLELIDSTPESREKEVSNFGTSAIGISAYLKAEYLSSPLFGQLKLESNNCR
jgi:hypothetical protein